MPQGVLANDCFHCLARKPDGQMICDGGKLICFPQCALPDDRNPPAIALEALLDLSVAFDIGRKFRLPELWPRGRD